MNRSLVIFAEKDSKRLRYLCRLMFDLHLGLDWSITTKTQSYDAYQGAKLNYSKQALEQGLQIVPEGLLFEDKVVERDIKTASFNGLTVPFANEGPVFPFDPFTAIFYMVSRYEEYLPFEPNQYGQFKATDSLAYKLGFLDQPVVELWLAAIKQALEKMYSWLEFAKPAFKATFTYDIDVAYAYKGRDFATRWGALAYDLVTFNWEKVRDRWQVLWGLQKDPFDTYDHILQQRDKNGHDIIFFFLVGPKTAYNHNITPRAPIMQQLIRDIASKEEIGIHPSYDTATNQQLLEQELRMLRKISDKKITKSRQHYLRIALPGTFVHLSHNSIFEDYTLGFAEMPGFRAGTCNPYYFYDLRKNGAGSLLLHPVTLMEGSYVEDMGLTPAAALPKMLDLAERVKQVNGQLVCIWHNHTLSNRYEWKGLREVHDALAAFSARPSR